MNNPFYITGPAVVSFSGGRTSAYMVKRIIDAHDGVLPDDVLVCFANTGREMPATLDFVQDCATSWNVCVHWLEYSRSNSGPIVNSVTHNSAARDGEPFELLLTAKSMLPNPVNRFCTTELKIMTIKRFVRNLGWEYWTNVIGLRSDEPKRVARAMDINRTKKDRWHNLCPLADAGIDEEEVFKFWKAQLFDLRLNGAWEGNCDGCFLKNRAALQRMFIDHPGRMAWWSAMEKIPHGKGAGGTFRVDREDYAAMARTMRDQGRLPFDVNEIDLPCELASCGG